MSEADLDVSCCCGGEKAKLFVSKVLYLCVFCLPLDCMSEETAWQGSAYCRQTASHHRCYAGLNIEVGSDLSDGAKGMKDSRNEQHADRNPHSLILETSFCFLSLNFFRVASHEAAEKKEVECLANKTENRL